MKRLILIALLALPLFAQVDPWRRNNATGVISPRRSTDSVAIGAAVPEGAPAGSIVGSGDVYANVSNLPPFTYVAGGGRNYLKTVLAQGSDVGIMREDYSSSIDAYWFVASLANAASEYACYELRDRAGGVTGPHALLRLQIRTPMVLTDQSAASPTKVGTWSTSTLAASFGGNADYSKTAGDTWAWTTAAGTTKVGIRRYGVTNGGFATVAIDGDGRPGWRRVDIPFGLPHSKVR